jgi:hypothetical protein
VTGPGPRRLDPGELGAEAPAELDDALTTAVWLEAAMLDVPVRSSADFADRVMAALENEPTPAAAGFLSPVRRLGFVAGFAASVRQAWASAFSGGRPWAVRASALAYVLAVAIAGTALAGAATVGVGSALGIIGPSETATPSPSPVPTEAALPTSLPTPQSAPPEPSPEPGESGDPESSDDHGGSSGPEPSDDHSDDASSVPSSSGSDSDDHSGPGSSGSNDSETATPRPSDTPKPTQTSESGGDD